MRTFWLILLLLTFTGWADDLKGKPDKTAPPGWLRYSFASGPGLSVVMPAAPQRQSGGASAGLKQMTMYVSTANQAVTLLEVMDFSVSVESPGFRSAFFEPAFSEFKKSFERSSHINLKVLGRKPSKLGSMTGFEESYDSPTFRGRLRIVMQGERGFTLGAFVPKKSAGLLDKFVDSAQLIP